MLQFLCACGQRLQAAEEHAGRMTRCPKCGQESVIGGAPSAASPVAHPLATRTHQPKRDVAIDHENDLPSQREATRSGKAIASLVLGVLSVGCSIFAGIPAIILGILALRDIRRGRDSVRGQGTAITGIVLAGLGTMVSALLMAQLLPVLQNLRTAVDRMMQREEPRPPMMHIQQLALAMHNYHAAFGTFPPASVYRKDGKPLYSWRVIILPYLKQDALYQQFHLDEPWDSPHNRPLLDSMPKAFTRSARQPGEPPETHYQVFVGGGAFFDGVQRVQTGGHNFSPPGGTRVEQVTDGLPNTILIVEAAAAVPWTKPEDLIYAPALPLPPLGNLTTGGFEAVFGDGRFRFIKDGYNEQLLRAAITRSGHEAVDVNTLAGGP